MILLVGNLVERVHVVRGVEEGIAWGTDWGSTTQIVPDDLTGWRHLIRLLGLAVGITKGCLKKGPLSLTCPLTLTLTAIH